MFVNVLALRAWIFPTIWSPRIAFVGAPFFLISTALATSGITTMLETPGSTETLSALLVQPLFPVESAGAFSTPERAVFFVMDQCDKSCIS